VRSSMRFSDFRRPIRALLSIKPEFVAAILRGEKRYEFRRKIFKRRVDVVIVYATVPVRRVVAEFRVQSIICRSPRDLWPLTRGAAGIDERRFFEYFRGRDIGYAIKIGRVHEYPIPFCPVRQFGLKAPQSFVYLPAARIGT
jgi:predicted transcriptional regulator